MPKEIIFTYFVLFRVYSKTFGAKKKFFRVDLFSWDLDQRKPNSCQDTSKKIDLKTKTNEL